MTCRIAVFLIAVVAVAAARADSDGSYCVGQSYLAYELRLAEPDDQHVLLVLRVELDQSIKTIRMALPDFQVHRMRCGGSAIELAGWSATYTFDLASPSPRVSVEPRPRPGDLPPWPNENLAEWNHEARDFGTATVELRWSVPYLVKIVIASTQEDCVKLLSTRLYRAGMTTPVMTLLERKVHVECGE